MPVTAHRYDKKSYETKPESKMSRQKYVTKPENRHPTHNYSVSQAESKVRGMGGGK